MDTCAACGTVSVGRYCVDCVASGQAAYDIADRRGDRAAMATAEIVLEDEPVPAGYAAAGMGE